MPMINLDGIEMYYELYGQGNPLVLIAGYTCDHTFYEALLDELSHYFQVLIFDNCGVGQTKDAGVPLTLAMMAENTKSLIEKLGLVFPHILGQSMGGAIAQIIARKYSHLISKLIVLNSIAKFNTWK